MFRKAFEKQLSYYQPLTADMMDRIEYKRVSSGNMMSTGDVVLYAYVIDDRDDIKMMTLLDRELPALSKIYDIVEEGDTGIPLLKKK